MIIFLKGCPRCGGDLFPDEDSEERYCLQCGYREPEKIKELEYVLETALP